MKNHLTHTPMTAKEKFTAWCELIRLDKPVGTELLLYPTLWALFLAAAEYGKLPSLKLIVIFSLGAFLMRSAGCAINDFADRKVDGQVKRTKGRPLADGRLKAKTAVMTFVGLALLSACLLFFLPIQVFYWSLVAVVLAFIYPFMKRHTHLPQVVLAAAFGFSVPMAFVAVNSEMGGMSDGIGQVGLTGWLTFIAYMCWTVAYDTQYAMCDRDDDVKIGVKSTAVLFGKIFGKHEIWAIAALQTTFAVLMIYLLKQADHLYHLMLAAFFAFAFYVQFKLLQTGERLNYFLAFRQNAIVGRVLFGVIVVALLVKFW